MEKLEKDGYHKMQDIIKNTEFPENKPEQVKFQKKLSPGFKENMKKEQVVSRGTKRDV